MAKFKSKKPHFEYLRKKWTAKHNNLKQNLIEKHFQKAALGSLGGLMLLSAPILHLSAGALLAGGGQKIMDIDDKNNLLKVELLDKVPREVRPLTNDEEDRITQVITKDLGIKVAAELEGKRLNKSYGLIGGEQHLYRYPGDTLYSHAKTAQDWAMYGSAGIAPGLGAWGYFAPSKAEFTEQDEQRERYYLAVQTFLVPGYAENVKEYRDFFKFRKMLVVNPKTGQAVVAVIGDAGPAEWTGKHLGGSPEVMHELGLAQGMRKGPVLYYFVDDPEDKIPLGPIRIADEGQVIRT
ncbi:hypothetical protein HYS97_00520 [Candidatus Daviesbacteria bacterium]|nr:hypothetical protein [Candidatus Daviesbacteria bacterium]